jgi:hypothetical protein
MVLTRVDATLVAILSTVSNVVAPNVCLLKCHAVEAQKNVIHCKMPLRNPIEKGGRSPKEKNKH